MHNFICTTIGLLFMALPLFNPYVKKKMAWLIIISALIFTVIALMVTLYVYWNMSQPQFFQELVFGSVTKTDLQLVLIAVESILILAYFFKILQWRKKSRL